MARARKAAALLTYSALSLSSAFAPSPPLAMISYPHRPRAGCAGSAISHTLSLSLGQLRGGNGREKTQANTWRQGRLRLDCQHRTLSKRYGAADSRACGGDAMNKLQKVLVACEAAFDTTDGESAPSKADLETVAMLLDDLSANELGVRQEDLCGASSILYTDVRDSEEYTICIFILPAGTRLPLHDHPNMVVLSKVLWGEMQVAAYDRVPEAKKSGGILSWMSKQSQVESLEPFQIVRKKENEVWTVADGVQLTGPEDCNIHEFTAMTPCCVIDVLAPPYDWRRGRRCTYYEVQNREGSGLWARPIRCPGDFVTKNLAYSGLAADLPDPRTLR